MCMDCICFFFQAEDGIRDLVRSRGLGDVYKRQLSDRADAFRNWGHRIVRNTLLKFLKGENRLSHLAVSYTHLTLPTIYSV